MGGPGIQPDPFGVERRAWIDQRGQDANGASHGAVTIWSLSQQKTAAKRGQRRTVAISVCATQTVS